MPPQKFNENNYLDEDRSFWEIGTPLDKTRKAHKQRQRSIKLKKQNTAGENGLRESYPPQDALSDDQDKIDHLIKSKYAKKE